MDNFSEQSWVRLRDELLDHSLRQVFRKSSLKFLSQPFSLFFSFSCHALTPIILVDANMFYMYILTKTNSNTNHIIHIIQFTINNTKISSHGLIIIQAIHFESTNNTKTTQQIT